MISQYFPHPDAPVEKEDDNVYNPNLIVYSHAKKHGITVEEWHRRDKIVFHLAKDCPYTINDRCIPTDPKGFVKYGEVLIQNIQKSYMEVTPLEEWPKNDNPLIVSAVPVDQDIHGTSVFICTTNYLEKVK